MNTPALYEKYRPRRLSQVVGQGRVVAKLRLLRERGGWAGRAFWISGRSGSGKSVLGQIIAREVADEFFVEELDASRLTPKKLAEIEHTWRLCAWGKGGRAYIVNEAHGLRKDTIRQLLVMLEPVPRNVAFVFTTSTEGQMLFEEGIDSSPLLSRCVELALTSQGVAPAFGHLARGIARREGLNGRPTKDYIALVNKHRGNLRRVLQDIGQGVMLGE